MIRSARGFTLISRSERAFTLIELLVVIAIISILAVIGITIFTSVQRNARDARRKADVSSIANAFEVRYQNNGRYSAVVGTNFNSGSIPRDPDGVSDYYQALASDGSSFKICAALDANTTRVCTTESTTCFCSSSAQSTINGGATLDQIAGGPTPAPTVNPTPTPSGPNLIVNGSFETDASGWSATNSVLSRDTSQFYLGVASGKLTVSAAGNAFFNSSALFPVTPGINYQMRAYTKSTDAVGDYVHHWVQWYNSSDVYLSDAAHPGIQLGSSWTQVVFSATAPVGATKARYLFAWGNLGGAGRSVYVDDIKFQAP